MSFNDRWRDDQNRHEQDRHEQDRHGQDRYGRDRYASDRFGQDRAPALWQDRDWQRGDEGSRPARGRSTEAEGWGRSGGMGMGSSGYRGGGQYEGMGDNAQSRTGNSGAYGSGMGMGAGGGGYGRDDGSRGYRGAQDHGRRGPYGSGSHGSETDRDYGRGYGMGEGGSRGNRSGRDWWDRTTDEVASWFGDDDAERRRLHDAQRDGEHRGRGPKGYARSDDRIREDICDRLTDDPMVDASEIEVSVSGSEVTLAGTVHRRDLRRRAEDLAESVSGVMHVQNNLRVAQGTGGTMGMGTEASRQGGTSSAGGGSLFGSGTNSGTGGEAARTEQAAIRPGGSSGVSGS
jgi:osmotically-inducible protein OsmY